MSINLIESSQIISRPNSPAEESDNNIGTSEILTIPIQIRTPTWEAFYIERGENYSSHTIIATVLVWST